MKRKSLKVAALALAVFLAADQTLQHTALADGELLGRWVVPFDPPLFTAWQKRRVHDMAAIVAGDEELRQSSIFDAELGWCPRPDQRVGAYAYDWSGSRTDGRALARTKDPSRRRVVAIGGSFTQGAEVEADETWAWLLGQRLDAEVANLGVAGYGVDQAYLRLRRDGLALQPDEVWLGLMPEAALRLTTHFPPVYRHWSSVVAFKPLFRLEPDGALRLVPNPATSLARALELLSDQQAFLTAVAQDDLWVRRSPLAFAPRGSSWTHWFATSRLAITAAEGGGRDTAQYVGDPDGELHRLLLALILAIDAEAHAAGATLRVLVLPSRPDLQSVVREGSPYWGGLLEELRASDVDWLDVGPRLLAEGAAEDPGGSFWMPQLHYSPRANEVVAEELASQLSERRRPPD